MRCSYNSYEIHGLPLHCKKLFGLECHIVSGPFFSSLRLSTPNSTVTIFWYPFIVQLTDDLIIVAFIRQNDTTCITAYIFIVYGTFWMMCFQIESFPKPFGLKSHQFLLKTLLFSLVCN